MTVRSEDFAIASSRAIEPYFYRAPHPDNVRPKEYQHAGVEYHLARDHALYGDAPGLGKSAECVLLGNAIEAESTLVICPASLRLNWEREVWMWSTIPNVTTYPILKARDGVSLVHNYVITSYDMLRSDGIFDAIMERRWDHLVMDEAHYLKEPKGNARTHRICAPDGLMSVAGRITLASGTILPNQPIECYNIFRLLDWDAIGRASLESFREYYYGLGEGFVRKRVLDPETQVWQSKLVWSDEVRNQPRNLDDLQRRLRRSIMVRRLKEQVMHELPRKQWHPFPIVATASMRAALRHPGWEAAERLYEMDPGAFDNDIPVGGGISTARLLLGEAKAPAVADFVEDLLDSGVEKVVVGAWHLSVLAYLRKRLEKYSLVYMDGSTSPARKQQAVDQFQTQDEVRIMLGQMLPLGEGWTLTRAQDVVLAEPFWVPGKNDQLLERIHRLGQQGDYVLGHIPVVPGSLDERIMSRAIEKDQHIHAALDKRWDDPLK